MLLSVILSHIIYPYFSPTTDTLDRPLRFLPTWPPLSPALEITNSPRHDAYRHCRKSKAPLACFQTVTQSSPCSKSLGHIPLPRYSCPYSQQGVSARLSPKEKYTQAHVPTSFLCVHTMSPCFESRYKCLHHVCFPPVKTPKNGASAKMLLWKTVKSR